MHENEISMHEHFSCMKMKILPKSFSWGNIPCMKLRVAQLSIKISGAKKVKPGARYSFSSLRIIFLSMKISFSCMKIRNFHATICSCLISFCPESEHFKTCKYVLYVSYMYIHTYIYACMHTYTHVHT